MSSSEDVFISRYLVIKKDIIQLLQRFSICHILHLSLSNLISIPLTSFFLPQIGTETSKTHFLSNKQSPLLQTMNTSCLSRISLFNEQTPLHTSLSLSLSLSLYLSIYLYIYLSIYLSLSLHTDQL